MADVSQQTFFQIGDGASPEEFLNLGEVVGISGPSLSVTALDVTNLADTAKAFIPSGVYDAGEITLDINFEPDDANGHDAMIDRLTGFTQSTYRIVFSDSGNGQAFTTDDGNNEIDIAAHGLLTGTPVTFTTTGNLPTGILVGTQYWLERVTAGTLAIYTTNALAIAGGGGLALANDEAGVNTAVTDTIWTFEANVTGAEPNAAVDEKLGATLTFKVSESLAIA